MPPNPSKPATREEIIGWDVYLQRTDLTAYDVLNVPRERIHDAQIETIVDEQYKVLIRAFHPDKTSAKHPELKEQCDRIAQKLNESFFSLRDPLRRRDYNVSIGANNEHGDATCGLPNSINATLLQGAYGKILVALSQLREFKLTLPKIVVVGLESAGKSSTLERLAMRSAFPRGEQFTTRMPILMKLRFRRHENKVTVKHQRINRFGNTRDVISSRTIEPTGSPLGAAQDVVDNDTVARMIQQAIIAAHPNDTGTEVLADEEIEIEICAPNVPNLDLIDLPGIVAMPPTVRAATIACTQRYLRDPNTLILLVIASSPGTIRGEAELARHIQEEADRNPGARIWDRTILVLSKVDMHPQHLAQRLVPGQGHLLDIPARRVVPVVNRTHDDGQSIHEAHNSEHEWFLQWCAANPTFAAKDMGMAGLLRHLSEMVDAHITNHWVPGEVQQLQAQLQPVEEEIVNLGQDVAAMTTTALMDLVAVEVLAQVSAFIDESDTQFAKEALTSHLPDGRACLTERELALVSRVPEGPRAFLGQRGPKLLIQYTWWLDRFLSEKLEPTLRGLLKDLLSRAMASTALPHRLCRFKSLHAQLAERIDTSRTVRDAIADVRMLVRVRGMLDEPESIGDRQRKLKALAVQHCVLKCFKPDSELFSHANLRDATQEDAHTVQERERLRQRVKLIEAAIKTLQKVAGL